MAASTSFSKKVKASIKQIPGAKPSIYNNQLLVSTGIPSLDTVLGGGLAVGTVLLIEEDAGAKYAEVMTRYFLAEGVVSNHALYVVSASEDPRRIMERLPAPVDEVFDTPAQQTSTQGSGDADDKMAIAWRYQNQPKVQAAIQSRFGHYYNLSKTMEGQRLQAAHVDCTSFSDLLAFESQHLESLKKSNHCRYHCVLQKIRNNISQGNFATSVKCEKRNILRIAIQGLGSALWGETGEDNDPSLCQFLLALRAQLRTAFAVCLITMPSHLFQSSAAVWRSRQLCDTVLRLHSFSAAHKTKNLALRDYSGLLHVVKLPCINQLLPHMPDTLDLAFRCRRKKFTVEKLHLPPEFSDTASREQDESQPPLATSMACSSSGAGASPLDF